MRPEDATRAKKPLGGLIPPRRTDHVHLAGDRRGTSPDALLSQGVVREVESPQLGCCERLAHDPQGVQGLLLLRTRGQRGPRDGNPLAGIQGLCGFGTIMQRPTKWMAYI